MARVCKQQTKLDSVFDENGIIKQMKDNYYPRESQITAAHKILAGLYEKQNLIIEGPCGFGKTFAYLSPCFDYINHKTKIDVEENINIVSDEGAEYIVSADMETPKVLVATNGISLQEQLANFDTPFVAEVFKKAYPGNRKVSIALLKGRQNFICKRKLSLMFQSIASSFIEVDKQNDFNKFITDTQTGDLSELSFVLDNDIAQMACCISPDECENKKCPMYSECYYQKHKKKAAASDIIICNYHLLFTGINVPVLPEFDILIMDEAHEAPDILRNFMSKSLNYNVLKKLEKDLNSIFKTDSVINIIESFSKDRRDELFCTIVDDFEKPHVYLVSLLFEALQDYMNQVVKHTNFNLGNTFAETYICEGHFDFVDASKMKTVISLFQNILTTLGGILGDEIEEYSFDSEEEQKNAEATVRKIDSILDRLDGILSIVDPEETDENDVFWAEKKQSNSIVMISVSKKPIKVGKIFDELFFSNKNLTSTIVTSATLSVNENFKYIKEELGLDITHSDGELAENPKLQNKELIEYIGASPFNLAKQELWYLPEYAVDGNKTEFNEYFSKLTNEMVRNVGGGILFLTTSLSSMKNCYDTAVRTALANNLNCKILKQGDAPRLKLLKEFKEDRDSILIATKSFFTGVDVPGDSLRCLVIDKFPFASPDDPVMKKLTKEDGGFFKYSIPQMVIMLKQAVGRGVRSITDKCVICVADGRMGTARYRAQVHKSFTYEKTATRNMQDVIDFVNNKEEG